MAESFANQSRFAPPDFRTSVIPASEASTRNLEIRIALARAPE